MSHHEVHRSHRTGWLRAAVLCANDGIVSTASLIIGVAAAHAAHVDILLAGVAGLVAGAMSMAAGEYVSVSSQSDTEKADLELEKRSLNGDIEFEQKELADIYVNRGLPGSWQNRLQYSSWLTMLWGRTQGMNSVCLKLAGRGQFKQHFPRPAHSPSVPHCHCWLHGPFQDHS
jgi:hypothetical protein